MKKKMLNTAHYYRNANQNYNVGENKIVEENVYMEYISLHGYISNTHSRHREDLAEHQLRGGRNN